MAGGARVPIFGCPKCRYSASGCERCKAPDYKPTKDCLLKRAAAKRSGGRAIPKTPKPTPKPSTPVAAVPVAPPQDANHSTRSRVNRSAAPPPSESKSRKGRSDAAPEASQKPAPAPEPVTEDGAPASAVPASREPSPKPRRAAKRSREATPESPRLRTRPRTAPEERGKPRPQPVTPLAESLPSAVDAAALPAALTAVPAQPEAQPEPATQAVVASHPEQQQAPAERFNLRSASVAAADGEPPAEVRPQRGRVPSRRAVAAAEASPGPHRSHEKLPPRASRGRKRDASQPPSEHEPEREGGQSPPATAVRSSGGRASRSRRQQLQDEGIQARYLRDLKRYVEERGERPRPRA